MKQSGFPDLEYDVKKKKTCKERFLTEMDEILPCKELLGVIKRHYPKCQMVANRPALKRCYTFTLCSSGIG